MCLARAVLTGYALVPVVMAGFAPGGRQVNNGAKPNNPAGSNYFVGQPVATTNGPPGDKKASPDGRYRSSAELVQRLQPPMVKSTGQPGKMPGGQPDIFKRLRDLEKQRQRAPQEPNPVSKASARPSSTPQQIQYKKATPTSPAKPSYQQYKTQAQPTFAQRMEDLRKKIMAQKAAKAAAPKPPAKAQPAKAPVGKPQPKPVAQPQPKSVGKLAMSERDLDESHKDFKYAAECIKLIQTNPSKMGTAQWTDYLETLNVIERDLPRLKALYAKHYSAAEQREGGKAKKIADDWLSKLQAQKALMMAISRPGINLPSKSPLMAVARALYQKGISARDAIWEYTNYSPVAEKVMSKDTDFKLRLKALERLCKGEDYMKELRKWR